jgi:hypothetical protein
MQEQDNQLWSGHEQLWSTTGVPEEWWSPPIATATIIFINNKWSTVTEIYHIFPELFIFYPIQFHHFFFHNFWSQCVLRCQEQCWMTNDLMMDWIKVVWKWTPGSLLSKCGMLVLNIFRGHSHKRLRKKWERQIPTRRNTWWHDITTTGVGHGHQQVILMTYSNLQRITYKLQGITFKQGKNISFSTRTF